MNLMHVKLQNTEELLAFVTEGRTPATIMLNSPVAVELDPYSGFFCKSWLLLSEGNQVEIQKSTVLFVNVASQKAVGYYNQFMDKIAGNGTKQTDLFDDTSDVDKDLEDMFNAMMESKSSAKH